ncbi:MAG: hypothetical protein M1814_006378 [Vezdaea aestivalis]|nr:MAG: hypothetical protein M1814_006378 [Vezdaea aestivalis]
MSASNTTTPRRAPQRKRNKQTTPSTKAVAYDAFQPLGTMIDSSNCLGGQQDTAAYPATDAQRAGPNAIPDNIGEHPIPEQAGQEDTPNAPSTKKKKKPRPKKEYGDENSAPLPIAPLDQSRLPVNQSPSAILSTPPKTAYAGPAFHASPAPSALPLPSFYSKSLPVASPVKDAPRELDESSSDSRPDSPTPGVGTAAQKPPYEREESPLDIFFKADREQKSRTMRPSQGPSTPVQSIPEAPRTHSTPRIHKSLLPGRPPNHSRRSTGQSSNGVFTLDIDSQSRSATPNSSPFAPPGRMPVAVRVDSAPSVLPTDDDAQRRASSQALKDLLFSSRPATSSGSSYSQSHSSGPTESSRSSPLSQRSPEVNRIAVDRTSPRPQARSGLRSVELPSGDTNDTIARRYLEGTLHMSEQSPRGAPRDNDTSVQTPELQDMERRLRGMLNLGGG